jgi:hypothetical protein
MQRKRGPGVRCSIFNVEPDLAGLVQAAGRRQFMREDGGGVGAGFIQPDKEDFDLNEDEISILALAAKREFPASDEAFSRVRAALVTRLFETAQAQMPERERLYQTVQVLDAVRAALLGAMGQGQAAIDYYVKGLAAKAGS